MSSVDIILTKNTHFGPKFNFYFNVFQDRHTFTGQNRKKIGKDRQFSKNVRKNNDR